MHRMIHTSIALSNLKKVDGCFQTEQFIGLTKRLILQDLFGIYQEHKNKFGELVICLDKPDGGYWRKDVYSAYKSSRKKSRDESDINYSEVFNELDKLIIQLKENLPWKVVEVSRAEADDIMLTLAREYNRMERVLIVSPDKDMLQAQRNTDNVYQYSPLTKKWLVPENKYDNMDHWILEHVCLGDDSDDVPRIVDGTEFSENFKKHLANCNIPKIFHNPYSFKNGLKDINGQVIQKVQNPKEILETFQVLGIYKTNRKGEKLELDIYEKPRFSPKKLREKIEEHGSLDKWLDSHPLYREHYERNYKLVMEEGIPSDIWNSIIISYKESKSDYNDGIFKEYLIENDLKSILMDLSSIFSIKRGLTAEDFNW